MVQVFKTNVQQPDQAKMIVGMLQEYFPASDINFDLEDCDKILRVKHEEVLSTEVPPLLTKRGFVCEELQ